MYQEIAIIAPTASGKTALSIKLAHKLNAIILSLDSLAIYKQIDIVSAKPSKKERKDIVHFGIDEIMPNEKYDVVQYIELYKKAKEYALKHNKNMIIVGGTSFYLKSLVYGISKLPKISLETKSIVEQKLLDLKSSYEFLKSIDEKYMGKIASTDKYRIEKALEIYYETKLAPSKYFENNKPIPIIDNIKIYQIDMDIEVLRTRIRLRTKKMLEDGLIQEVKYLEKKYTREPNCMSSIGIIETLSYLDGEISLKELEELISIHTGQLAKRQRTFNKSQFKNVIKDSLENLENKILNDFSLKL